MKENPTVLTGKTRVSGFAEGEALVTSEKLSHLANAIGSDGVIRMHGHPLNGESYAGKIVIYDTDKFSTGGAFGLYFKAKIARTGPKALICRKVHPISVGGAVDAEIPAADGFDQDPCLVIKTGDWVRLSAPQAGGKALLEVFHKGSVIPDKWRPEIPTQRETMKAVNLTTQDELFLTPYENDMLSGKYGKYKQIAMERLVRFGQGMGSKKMVRLHSAHVFCDWKTDDLTAGAWPLYQGI